MIACLIKSQLRIPSQSFSNFDAVSSGSSCTLLSLPSIWRVFFEASSIDLLASWSFFWVLSSRSPNLPNWVFTAPRSFQTSLDLCSMARVRKPICKLFRMAASVVGPTGMILYSLCRNSKSPGILKISAYSPSTGKYMRAKSVVCGGSIYLFEISLANNLISALNLFVDWMMLSLLLFS